MPVAACPSAETLSAFVRGDLDPAALATVADHVGGCAACCRTLQRMPNGTLAALAREAAASPTLHPEATPAPVPPPAPTPFTGPATVPPALQNHLRYRVVSELGRGGMGTVYKAEDTWMSRTIALKVVSAHLTAKASALARFRKEIQAAAELAHTNIVRAYDTGEAGGSQFLVMEYVEGMSLDKLVAKKGRLSVPLACALIRQAAMGLQHAADKGMVHRDIKPQNLLVTKKGQLKILDFGLARFAASNDASDAVPAKVPFGAARLQKGKAAVPAVPFGATNPNLLMGTPDYLSPEQAQNAAGVDPRSDIYSLGCTLYYLLAGRPPFAGTGSLLEKLTAHAEQEPPSIRLERLEVTAELAAAIAKMMAKKPEDRFQTAAEAAAALQSFVRAEAAKGPGFEVVEEVTAPPTPPAPQPKPVAVEVVPEPAERAEVEPARPRKKRKKRASWWSLNKGRVVGAAAALAAVVAVALTADFVRKRFADTPSNPTPDAIAKAPSEPSPAKDAPTDKGEKIDKGDDKPPTPPPVTPPKADALRVLYVLPSAGAHRGDFEPTRDQLEKRGVKVVTATPAGLPVRPDTPGADIPVDVRLAKGMNLGEYAAVVFAGSNVDEYITTGTGAEDAKWLIEQMQSARKPVAAIGLGQSVFVHHGTLKGRKAAPSQKLFEKYPPLLRQNQHLTGFRSGIKWELQPGVATDGKVVTASGEKEGAEFADAIIRAIEGK